LVNLHRSKVPPSLRHVHMHEAYDIDFKIGKCYRPGD
jgi:hypothetical protein